MALKRLDTELNDFKLSKSPGWGSRKSGGTRLEMMLRMISSALSHSGEVFSG